MLHACLYTICSVFCYTSWRFYAFYRTNLLTRCHSASFLFLLFCVSEKLHRKYSRNWTKQKPEFLFFPIWDEVPRWHGGAPEGGHTMAWRGPPLAVPWPGVGPWPTLWRRPSAYIIPSMGNPKGPINFPRNVLQAAAVVDARSGGLVTSQVFNKIWNNFFLVLLIEKSQGIKTFWV
jgi:hypothetical protein